MSAYAKMRARAEARAKRRAAQRGALPPVARYRVLCAGLCRGDGPPHPVGAVLELRTDLFDVFTLGAAPMLERLPEDAP